MTRGPAVTGRGHAVSGRGLQVGSAIPDSGLLHDWEASNFDGSTWTDKEGSLDLTATGDPALESSGYNGEPAVYLDGVDDYFSATGLSLSPPYVVFQVVDLVDNDAIADTWGGGGSNEPEFLYRFDQSTIEYRLETTGGNINGGGASTAQEITSALIQDGSQTIRRNATDELTGGLSAGTWSDIKIGEHSSSSGYTEGYIARTLIYDYSQMDSGQITDVESALNDIYGVY